MRVFSPKVQAAVLVLVGGLLILARAESQEYCVSCTDPPAIYRCIIEGAKPGGSVPLPAFCTTVLAKQGQHAKCGLKGGTVFDCDGAIKRIPWTAQIESQPPASAPPADKQAAGSDTKQPPRTVEEMARRAKEDTAEQIKSNNEKMKDNAKSFGDKVGNATKKTWRCVASFFTQCSD